MAPIGILWMADEHGPDAKVLTVLAQIYEQDGLREVHDLPMRPLRQIEYFFGTYKDLEPDESVTIPGIGSR